MSVPAFALYNLSRCAARTVVGTKETSSKIAEIKAVDITG